MNAIRPLAVILMLGIALGACASGPKRSPLPKDRNAVNRISDAYVRAVELQGQGDCEKAIKLFRRVAMQGAGYEDAQRRLGECTILLAGSDSARYKEGIVWLRRAAEAGWPEAQGALAYEYAAGPTPDLAEAARWLALYQDNPRMKRLGFTPLPAAKLSAIRARLTPEQIEQGRTAAKSFAPVVWVPPATEKQNAVKDLDGGEESGTSGAGERRDENGNRPIGGEFPQPGQ
ncbi:MAG: hypothetical protein AB7O49_13490 [Sphingomonadales bacterium]